MMRYIKLKMYKTLVVHVQKYINTRILYAFVCLQYNRFADSAMEEFLLAPATKLALMGQELVTLTTFSMCLLSIHLVEQTF